MNPAGYRRKEGEEQTRNCNRELVAASGAERFGPDCSCKTFCCSRAQPNGRKNWAGFRLQDPPSPTPERPVPPPAAHFFVAVISANPSYKSKVQNPKLRPNVEPRNRKQGVVQHCLPTSIGYTLTVSREDEMKIPGSSPIRAMWKNSG